MILLARQNCLRQRRIHRELGHPSTHLGQLALVVERAQRVQEIQRANEGIPRRRVEKVEPDEVVDTEGFEHQDDGAEVRTLDLGNGVLVEFVRVGVFGVKAEALAGTDATGSSCALTGGSAGALKKERGK
jgi:hypothetical protein